MTMIEEALTQTTDTKACEIGPGATEAAAKMFRGLFPDAEKAVVIEKHYLRKHGPNAYYGQSGSHL